MSADTDLRPPNAEVMSNCVFGRKCFCLWGKNVKFSTVSEFNFERVVLFAVKLAVLC
jgi:hypothetical protein